MTSYATFIKHAEKVTKSASSALPILKGVCHNVDGSVVVTDARRLYVLTDGYKTDEQTVIDTKTGATIDGNYPDTNRLQPYEDDAIVTLEIDVAKALQAVKAMFVAHKAINEQSRHVTIEFTSGIDGYPSISVGDIDAEFNARYLLARNQTDKIESTYVQAQYLQDALSLFKDSGEATATIRLYGPARPVTIKNTVVTALLLPVLTY